MAFQFTLVLLVMFFPPIQAKKQLPVTIQVQRDVDVRHNTLSYELKGVLYLFEPTDKDFQLKKGERFQMIETLNEGGCRIKFEGKYHGITSCPWLDGFSDHQESVFRIVSSSPEPQWNADVTCSFTTTVWKKPFRVRQIVGSVMSPADGQWSPDADVIIEIVSKAKPTSAWTARALPSGAFQIAPVPDGEYFFRAGLKQSGFACTEGVIIVSKSAPKDSKIQVGLILGT